MGRNQKEVYFDPKGNSFYARFTVEEKLYRLSLNTRDEAEAWKRLPIIKQVRLSWNQYQKSISKLNTLVINSLDQQKTPGLTFPGQTQALQAMADIGLANGSAFIDDRGYVIFKALAGGVATDSTAMYSPAPNYSGLGFMQGLDSLQLTIDRDDGEQIDKFFSITVGTLFKDQSRVKRVGNIWLNFIHNNKVKSWNAINEEVIEKFKKSRMEGSVARGRNGKVAGKSPSVETLTRDLSFLQKCFEEAVKLGFMRLSPLRNYNASDIAAPPVKPKTPLTLSEIKKVFDALPEGTVRDTVLLLFVGNKRRKEVVSLKIEDVNFDKHYISYIEFKNYRRQKDIHKAFWMTPLMETFLKRIIGSRTEGSLWDPLYHPDFISHHFGDSSSKIAPLKYATLKDMRQCATMILEEAGYTDREQDISLGHISLSKSLGNYQRQNPQIVYMRYAKQTKPVVEALSKAVKEYLK